MSLWDDISSALNLMPKKQPVQPGTPAAAIPPQQDSLGELLKIAGGLYGESLRARGGLIGSGIGSLMEAPYLKEHPPTGPMGNRGQLFRGPQGQLQYFPGQTQIPQGYTPYVKPGATGKGTWQHITLPDGTEADYNPDTKEVRKLPGKFYQKPTGPKIPGGVYAGAYMAHMAAHPGDTAGATAAAQAAELKAREASKATINVNTPLPPSDLLPNPADPTGKTAIVIEHGKSGNVTTRVVPVPAPPRKGDEAPKPTTMKVSGHSYELTLAKGDPNFGVARLTEAEPMLGRSVPKFIWRVDGRPVDPTTLPKEKLKAYAKKLTDKGFTLEEIMPTP